MCTGDVGGDVTSWSRVTADPARKRPQSVLECRLRVRAALGLLAKKPVFVRHGHCSHLGVVSSE